MDESVVRHLEQKNDAAYVLRMARALIQTPDKWCQFEQKDHAGRLCAQGAISVITSGDVYCSIDLPAYKAATRVLVRAVYGEQSNELGVADFNNTSDHAEVLQAFDRAIALAEQEATEAAAVSA